MSTKCWITAVNKRVLWIRYDSASTRRGQTWSFKRHTWPSGSLLPSKCLLNNGGTVSKTSVMCSLPFWMCARVQEDIILWPEVRRLLFLLNKLISDPCQQQRKSFQRRWPKLSIPQHKTVQVKSVISGILILYTTSVLENTRDAPKTRTPKIWKESRMLRCCNQIAAITQPQIDFSAFTLHCTPSLFNILYIIMRLWMYRVTAIWWRYVTSILTTQIYGQTSPKVVWTPLTYPGRSTCP